jgi:hypothetical protein
MSPYCTLLMALALVSNRPKTPALPIGLLIVWWICARRKQHAIGGWLAYYYYQLYVGILISVGMIAGITIQSYVPEYFSGDHKTYVLFLLSALPILILTVFEAVVATFLMALKTWDLVQLLRKVLIALVAAQLIGLVIDIRYFPDNIPLSLLAFVSTVLWTGYFYRSKRVHRVFESHDWGAAVA